MLAELFWVTLVAGCSAAAVVWVLAVRIAGTIAASRGGGFIVWSLAVLWPFGARQTAGVSTETSASLNKMLVGFFIAILVAIASMAVYSNLTFVPPTR
ncbi:hypothetical protein ACO2RV_10620 [Ancylobacter sp. VNQ12]|uniref:hypothetical protein n=1 Tax=Ancylobacter sp. VNQ12 TaxID=3400920 RepID=UPI003C08B513